MSSELMEYARGQVRPRRQDRGIARQAEAVYREVQLRSLMAEGSMALAGRIMERAVELHRHRQRLVGEDPILDALLMPFQNAALNHVQTIQAHLYDPWGL
jgi:hypothetical protein